MGRIPVKSTEKLAAAAKKGELTAENKFRQSEQGQWRSLQEHIGKFLDAMANKIDPLELAAIAATTFLVHEVILSIEGLAVNIVNKVGTGLYGIGQAVGGAAAGSAQDLNAGIFNWASGELGILNQFLPGWGFGDLSTGFAAAGKTGSTQPPTVKAGDTLTIWLISFVIAYIIINYGPAIIQSFGGISGIATKLVGLV